MSDENVEKDATTAARYFATLLAHGTIERAEALELTKIYVGILKAIDSQANSGALSAVRGALS